MNNRNSPFPLLQLFVLVIPLALLLTALLGGQNKIELDNVYVSSDGSFSFRYPQDWFTEKAAIPNPPGSLKSVGLYKGQIPLFGGDIHVGDATGLIIWGNSHDFALLFNQDTDLSLVQFGDLIVKSTPQGATADVPQSMILAGKNALLITGRSAQLEQFGLILDFGANNFAMIAIETSLGEVTAFEPTLLTIAETLRYSPPPS